MLDKEFEYYLDNQDELVKKYNNKYVVIVGQEVVGAYDSVDQAYYQSLKKYELGTFLIQECTPGDEAYTQTIYSRAIFK
jgi:hypothetical protein